MGRHWTVDSRRQVASPSGMTGIQGDNAGNKGTPTAGLREKEGHKGTEKTRMDSRRRTMEGSTGWDGPPVCPTTKH